MPQINKNNVTLNKLTQLNIVTRSSALALWQTNYFISLFSAIYPDIMVNINPITTKGDKILDTSLDKIGGKGLFIKELEVELLNNRADIAVHSLKDVSTNLNSEFLILPFSDRLYSADVLICPKDSNIKSLDDLKEGAIIGTSSSRRIAYLKKHYPKLQIKLLRGNINTRIAKLDKQEYDAIILAQAGVMRLGMQDRITQVLDANIFIPAIAQGVLALEFLSHRDELYQLLKVMLNQDVLITSTLERMVGKLLDSNCSTPLAVYAQINNSPYVGGNNITRNITINAMLCNMDFTKYKYFNNTYSITLSNTEFNNINKLNYAILETLNSQAPIHLLKDTLYQQLIEIAHLCVKGLTL